MIEWFHHLADNPAEAPVVASWFVSSVALVTAFVTVVIATITARTTYKVASRNTYINSVTAERSKWIDAFRRSIADFSGAAERIYARRQDPKYQASAEWANDVQSLRTHFASLKMRLNPREQASINFLTAALALEPGCADP